MTCVTTGGHIDEFCRFVSADTVLVAEVSNCSYNNFLITNVAILAPQYWKPGLPERIKEVRYFIS